MPPLLVTTLLCEQLVNPLGVDEPEPRFSWRIESQARGVRQSAFQIQAATQVFPNAPDIWESGKVIESRSFDIPFNGKALAPRERYFWRVRVWDQLDNPSPWSEAAWFETGLLTEKWRALWIGLPRHNQSDAPPAIYLQRDFVLPEVPAQARLYITALGIFDASINGQRAGNDLLAPGWTDYRHRLDYLVYDVSSYLRAGANQLRVTLGDGWWSGILSEPQFNLRYGTEPSLLAQLIIQDLSGNETAIVTDAQWLATAGGPIRENALYHGETFDARIEPLPSIHASCLEWPEHLLIQARHCPPIREAETRASLAISEPAPGVRIFDFGENITGWVRLKVSAPRGTEIKLRFGEMLEADGSLYTANLRSARATDRYICNGSGEESWEPRFTFHGFRYVEASGGAEALALTAVIIHSALADTGHFECSDPLVNRLQRCIVRGQKGNFLDLPTDCPQRDERLGWSGDAQIFAPTACYNMASGPLFRSWMRSMRDGQRADGALPDLAPHIILEHGNAGWGDAGIIVPWVVWQFSGDTRILSENYESMARHVEFMRTSSRELIRPDTLFGDWLAVDAALPQHGPTPKDLIGTAYFAHCARLLGQIAEALGKDADARQYEGLFEKIRAAFQREFITAAGRVLGDTQTSLLLALGFDLMPEKLKPAAINRLVELISSRDWHLTTGFLGTPLLAPVLTACGRADVAYRLLKQESYPSWLYPVLQGATTMWERWNSWTREKGFGDVGMNSFNHYAYGAIGQWLYSTAAGIAPLKPGFECIEIRPQPGGEINWASAEIDSPMGLVRSHWKLNNGSFELRVTIPPNATTIVHLPASPGNAPTESGRLLEETNGVLLIQREPGKVVITVGSGDYLFRATPPSHAHPP